MDNIEAKTDSAPELGLVPGSRPSFRAGDVVKHGPTGETWTLANDEENGRVSPAGWPCCLAEAKDCELVKASGDAERVATLLHWALMALDGGEYDHRVSTAKHQIAAANAAMSHAEKDVRSPDGA